MSKYCPILKNKVTYLSCMECEEKCCCKDTQEQGVISLEQGERVSNKQPEPTENVEPTK